MLLSLVLVRILVHRLGGEHYAIFALVPSTVGYLGLLDLGLAEAMVKYAAGYRDTRQINVAVNTTFFSYVVLGLVGCGLLAGFTALALVRTYNVAPGSASPARFVFYVAAIAYAANMPFGVFNSLLQALQRLDLVRKLSMVFGTLHAFAAMGVLLQGGGLRALAVATSLVSLAGLLGALVVAKRVQPELRFGLRFFDWAEFRKLFRFGWVAVLGRVFGYIIYQCDVTLLAVLVHSRAVTLYDIPNRLASKLYLFAHAVYDTMYPLVSSVETDEGMARVARVFETSVVFMFVVTAAPAVIVARYAELLLTLWVGAEYAHLAPYLQFLALAWALNAVGSPCTFTSKGVGRPWVETVNAALVMVLNIVLDVILILKAGVLGAVVATAISQAFGVTRNLIVVSGLVEHSRLRMFGRLGVCAAGAGVCALALACPAKSFVAVGASACAFLTVYALAAWFVMLSQAERAMVRSLWRKALGKL